MDAPSQMIASARLSNRPVRLSSEVAIAVTREIITEAFPVGSALPAEPVLGDIFGVSRAVIREAIKLVQQNGLVRVRQGEGTTVQPREAWNLLDSDVLRIAMETETSPVLRQDVVAMRADLEVSMLRRAAANLKSEDFEAMANQLKIIDAASDNEVLHNADREFHSVVYRASGNEIARTIVLLLIAETRPVSYIGVPGPEDFSIANQSHYRVYELLKAGDIDGAAAALREHITTQWMVDRTH
jgi:DNA-binding FadR family transcriptional regulator